MKGPCQHWAKPAAGISWFLVPLRRMHYTMNRAEVLASGRPGCEFGFPSWVTLGKVLNLSEFPH